MKAKDEDASSGGAKAAPLADETPLSSSGVVVRPPPGSSESSSAPDRRRRRDSDPPSYRLTPYQARLDVEMDDTAVSKVRDPSVSIRLGGDGGAPVAARGFRRLDAAASVALGAVLGVLLVVVAVWIARALGR